MKTIRLPLGRQMDHTPKHPERTARRVCGFSFDLYVEFREWTNRKAMARTIRLQEFAASREQWHAIIPLETTEGY